MLKLSKKVEYGILAAQYLASKSGELVSAKDMAENLEISFEFLAKTLQALMKHHLVVSVQGTRGGYQLSKDASQISIADIAVALGDKPKLVDCLDDEGKICDRKDDCTIRNPLIIIHEKIEEIFKQTSVNELLTKQDLVQLIL